MVAPTRIGMASRLTVRTPTPAISAMPAPISAKVTIAPKIGG